MKIAKLPSRPSHLLELPDAGYSKQTCLAFDLACVEFDESYDRALNATIQKPLSKSERKRPPTKSVPKYSKERLMQFLGLMDEDEIRQQDLTRLTPQEEDEVASILAGDSDWLNSLMG